MVPGMIKPKHLQRGDTVAIVSLSAGTRGALGHHKLDTPGSGWKVTMDW